MMILMIFNMQLIRKCQYRNCQKDISNLRKKDYNKNWSNKNPDYFKELCKTQGEIERKKNWRLDNPEYNKKYREES